MSTHDGYGYGGRLAEIRREYGTIPRAYLDNAGAPLFPHTIPRLMAEALCAQPLMNPHSQMVQASGTGQLIADTRTLALRNLGCDPAQYELVFCANATAAAKLVGEALYDHDYAYLQDSHTSLVGLRSVSRSYRACRTLEELSATSAGEVVSWPLQSNFDGRRYDESGRVIEIVHKRRGLVLLDVAAYAATEAPDLGRLQPDFAVLSFYKIYGLPDLGALIVRKSRAVSEFFSRKRYFGGGTVAALAPSEPYVARRNSLTDILEDGTAPFHSILMLSVAVKEFDRLYGSGHGDIARHTKAVARYCKTRLAQVPGCSIFAPSDSPIVSFMLHNIGHNEFCTAAALQDVHVRAGTVCNIGAFTNATRTSDKTIIHNHTELGKNCNDGISYINGKPTGVVRVSFGPYSSYEDVDALLDVIESVTASPDLVERRIERASPTSVVRIAALYTYPIKSCSGISVHTSLLGSRGLQYDRDFCLLDLNSDKVLSLKNHRTMASLKPAIAGSSLIVHCDRLATQNKVTIPYNIEGWTTSAVQGKFIINNDPTVIDFFTRAVGIPCTIAKQNKPSQKTVNGDALEKRMESSLANSSPLLVVSLTSAAALELESVSVFRPNIVIETDEPWAEDTWSTISFRLAQIQMLGKCRRCNMVTVTADGQSDSTPYMQLCKYRKQDGKIFFGQHATVAPETTSAVILEVGEVASEIQLH